MTIPVITAGETSAGFVGSLERLHGPVTVVRRYAELAEVVAACQTGIARAAIIADVADGLNSSLVERMNVADVAVVALSADESERLRLEAIGAFSAAVDVSAEELSEVVASAVQSLAQTGAFRQRTVSSGYADPGASLTAESTRAQEADAPARPEGQIMAVWGPGGAPGRTTVALNLAAELAAAGKSTMLVDADTYGASIATALGLLDESAGLAQACRLADQGLLTSSELDRVGSQVIIGGGRLSVLTGITRADRWPELRSAALAEVLELCRRSAEYTIVDCGFCLEADEELSFDTQAPRRNGATLRSLELADVVFAVGAADAIGVPRLVRALAELETAVPSAAPKVLFNRVRASATGRSPRRQLREAWERYGPGVDIEAYLPSDAGAADAALMAGSSLLESAPGSPFRAGVAEVAGTGKERGRRNTEAADASTMKFSRRGVRLLSRRPR
ncbi:AAA family ATPase [Arthrobacter castelli]|uniref:AAA family ATPase n=1 Tax=Arthrobacter castelli TaxID=271431 RepID=UPI00041EAC61|nr:P-loop NTPase [Arthrobacter castelli]